MKQFTIVAVFACLLAACGPASPPADAPQNEQSPGQRAVNVPAMDEGAPDPMANSERAGAVWSDVANEDVAPGDWSYFEDPQGSGATASLAFEGEMHVWLSMHCDRARKRITWWLDAELAPDQPTGLGFLTRNARYVFAARSENTDMPNITADIPADDPRLDVIAASESFALQYTGWTPLVPGDPEDLSRVLTYCRS